MAFEAGSASEKNLMGLGDAATPPWLTPENIRTVGAAEPLPFPSGEYADRMARVRERLSALDADAILVFRPSAVEYLCGYHTAETAPQPLLVTPEDTYLYVLDLEVGRALASSDVQNVLYCSYANTRNKSQLIAEHVVSTLPQRARLAIEFGNTSTPPQMIGLLGESQLDLVDGQFLVENLKLVLSPAEIRCMEQAAEATRRGVDAAVLAAAEPDATDASVAGRISQALLSGANAASAWGPLVVTEPRSGIPHSSWKGDRLSDETTFLEFAGACHRYHAPVMRTLVQGRPSRAVLRLAGLAKTTLAAVLENAKPGVPCSQVAEQCLKEIGPLGDEEVFHHMLGYPVGLAHPPHWMDTGSFYITKDNPEPLRAGMAFHVPASFRSFGVRCVGLSQTFLVEETGTRVLTHGAADLIEL
ncbi:M24 family metallopeptidase [Streptomyces albidus (ex Kaewkla and Franco 2022)]|uniref:M24 family metallopeptidase n=1 Tax=Streptomyces albidus (ex Kaewkla and Franco 2022) TaxID=722709 RepID=UPI0015EF74A3|nr:Xaa-Pro peptidase family protein [Streptomyces albidus (ex Kaewkla and Franco 2022)]